MLYEEFREGTGCRDNQYNYKVYKDLEIIYMNSDITKNEIYEYGKKLVNNGLTDKQKEWNREMDERIEKLQGELADWQRILENDEKSVAYWKEQGKAYEDVYKRYKRDIKMDKDEIRRLRIEIRNTKSCKYI